MGDVSQLAAADVVASLAPPDARYVTVGPVAVIPDVRSFNHGEPGSGRYGRDLGYLPAALGQEIALLVLTHDRLAVIERSGERWSRKAREVTHLDGRRRGGFLMFTSYPDGLAVGQQTPVELPPGAEFETVRGMTNLFTGWDPALAPFGAQTHF